MAEITGKSPTEIEVPVIGGHAGVTIMPVFSQDGTVTKPWVFETAKLRRILGAEELWVLCFLGGSYFCYDLCRQVPGLLSIFGSL